MFLNQQGSQRGWLQNKRYQDNSGPDYTYYLSGRLKERSWARGTPRIKTTYTYNYAGDLQTVDYSDSTADVSYSYDRLGRQSAITQGATVVTRSLNRGGSLVRESWSGGILNGLTVSNSFDHWLRRTNLAVRNGATQLAGAAYGYDSSSRLWTVTSGPNSATYSYLANSPLISQIAFANNGVARMTTSKQHDLLNRLTTIQSANPQGTAVVAFSYTLNEANQRTLRREADGTYWRYEYDQLGQVISGKKYWQDGSPARPVRYYGCIYLRLHAAQLKGWGLLRRLERRCAPPGGRAPTGSGAFNPSTGSSGIGVL